MSRSPVVIFAENELHSFYKALAVGLQPAEILSCRDAFDWVSRGKAALAVIDCGFRVETGLKLLREVKRAGPDTIVLMVAEKSSEETVIEAFRSGARYYLRKPVEASELRDLIRDFLKLKRETAGKRSPYVGQAKPAAEAAAAVRSDRPANLLRAVRYIEENLGEPLDLEACARAGNLSRFQFCRAFKKHFGTSPMGFVTRLRVDRAQDLLRRNDLNISEIAFQVGFKDHGSFIRAFRKYQGLLPRDFRKSVQAEASVRLPQPGKVPFSRH